MQCVAEADGRAYPCDFYAMDGYCLGNYNENRIEEFFENETAKQFVRESLKHDEDVQAVPVVSTLPERVPQTQNTG